MFRIRMSPETKVYAETALTDIVGVIIGYTILKILIILL